MCTATFQAKIVVRTSSGAPPAVVPDVTRANEEADVKVVVEEKALHVLKVCLL